MVIYEYYFWTSHRTKPEKPTIKRAIDTALQSFKDSNSEIDVGKYLHGWLHELGMGIVNHRLMPKLAFEDLNNLETLEYATLWWPLMIEVIATK